ncbi:MAG: SpoIIE family protein phosphatase, partial [Desulfobulbaceae bacterium]|nr:SpoIIE family protein phosphatase [Desulfobulbaceae bacterium]
MPELKGPSLGIAQGIEYEKKEIFVSLGESILFITDGVVEAENERNELFGQRRLTDFFQKAKGPPLGKSLLDAVNAWRGIAETNDDLTIL